MYQRLIQYWATKPEWLKESKKQSKLHVTGHCVGNSPGTGEFPTQMASYTKNVFFWCHHGIPLMTCDQLNGVWILHPIKYMLTVCHVFVWIWSWHNQMEIFSTLLALCAGNSPDTGKFPQKGQWHGALMFSLICAWTNGWVNNRDANDLRHHRTHYDITIVSYHQFLVIHVICLSILSWVASPTVGQYGCANKFGIERNELRPTLRLFLQFETYFLLQCNPCIYNNIYYG